MSADDFTEHDLTEDPFAERPGISPAPWSVSYDDCCDYYLQDAEGRPVGFVSGINPQGEANAAAILDAINRAEEAGPADRFGPTAILRELGALKLAIEQSRGGPVAERRVRVLAQVIADLRRAPSAQLDMFLKTEGRARK